MDFDGIDFDDVIKESEEKEKKKKKKKPVKSKDKGGRVERALGKILFDRFGFEFTRTLGSGNRHGQVFFLPPHAQQTFSGDLVCPENFKFVIECKGGYNDIDLFYAVSKGHAELDSWLEQVESESERCGRLPAICWKKDYKPWLAFIKAEHLKTPFDTYQNHFFYKGYVGGPLDDFLKFKDEFFYVN